MKILVFSDSHGNTDRMLLATELERPDVLFHLGDCWRDADVLADHFPQLPMYRVPGNCDWSCREPDELRLALGGVSIILCHGHTYAVKFGYGSAVLHARTEHAQLLLCGHTHRTYYEDLGDLQVFNPGSVGMGSAPSYGVILLQNGIAACHVKTAP